MVAIANFTGDAFESFRHAVDRYSPSWPSAVSKNLPAPAREFSEGVQSIRYFEKSGTAVVHFGWIAAVSTVDGLLPEIGIEGELHVLPMVL